MPLTVTPSGQACGATVTGVDLTSPLSPETVAEIREAWLEHHVLAFPDQPMSDDDLERFTRYFGPFGHDPYIAPLPGRTNVIAVKRDADETTRLFAEGWHSDWSFQENPPAGTCLFGITIPPAGGDTLFANQHRAAAEMPADLRAKLDGRRAIHSAAHAYAPDGFLGDDDKASGRSMDILPSEEARASHPHPILRPHPETGEETIHGCAGYITAIEGYADDDSRAILRELYHWQSQDAFVYRHHWEPNMLVMWDNRSVLHRATGGYEGHDRLLHRTTIGSA